MAKYEIEHNCGHTATHNIIGSNRESQKSRLANQNCESCKQNNKRTVVNQLNKAAEEKANSGAHGLAYGTLEGTEAQIKWARTIRQEVVDKAIAEAINLENAGRLGREEKPVLAYIMRFVAETVAKGASAKWIIDNRGKELRNYVDECIYRLTVEGYQKWSDRTPLTSGERAIACENIGKDAAEGLASFLVAIASATPAKEEVADFSDKNAIEAIEPASDKLSAEEIADLFE